MIKWPYPSEITAVFASAKRFVNPSYGTFIPLTPILSHAIPLMPKLWPLMMGVTGQVAKRPEVANSKPVSDTGGTEISIRPDDRQKPVQRALTGGQDDFVRRPARQ